MPLLLISNYMGIFFLLLSSILWMELTQFLRWIYSVMMRFFMNRAEIHMNKNGGGFINSFFYESDFYGIRNMTDDSLAQTWSVKWEWDCCFAMKIEKSMEWTDEWIFWLWLKFIDKSFKLERKKISARIFTGCGCSQSLFENLICDQTFDII